MICPQESSTSNYIYRECKQKKNPLSCFYKKKSNLQISFTQQLNGNQSGCIFQVARTLVVILGGKLLGINILRRFQGSDVFAMAVSDLLVFLIPLCISENSLRDLSKNRLTLEGVAFPPMPKLFEA